MTSEGGSNGTTLPLISPNRGVVISTLGVTQIFAWGSTYYLPAVLAAPMGADTGWPLPWVAAGVSVGLLMAGLVSPRVGRAIDRNGGRRVLGASSALIGAGLLMLAFAHGLVTYFAGWLVLGLGMGTGLYDAAFATLGRYYGREARSAITTLTLWGGFASTVCWPLSAFLVEAVGWRGTCLAYSAFQLLVALPMHLWLLPPAKPVVPVADNTGQKKVVFTPAQWRAFLLMAGVVTIGGAVSSLVSVHLLTMLQASGVSLAAAVSLGALIGPAQVGARVIEMAFGRHYHPVWTMSGATLLVAIGLALLATGWPLAALALILYGCGTGIFSIGRGTLPLALFGADGYATLMGRLAVPSLIAQALAPSVGAVAIAQAGAGSTFTILTVMAFVNVCLATVLLLSGIRIGTTSDP
ncbi:MAG TPA: MFS transporter [Mesorhizobium sp.]|jgi:MFS family permease|nr:MFS transporter [Mesorhizobium sp.]